MTNPVPFGTVLRMSPGTSSAIHRRDRRLLLFFCDSAKEKKGNFKTKPKTFFFDSPYSSAPHTKTKRPFRFL